MRGPPMQAKFRRLPPNKLHDAKQAIQEMKRMGVCRKASRPWASPLHMVPVNPGDIPKLAIITLFSTYAFAYSTFGLRNAGATLQRLMDSILGDLPFCCCYIDNILMFSKSQDEHLRSTPAADHRCQQPNLRSRLRTSGQQHPAAYRLLQQKLNSAEQRYSTFDRELLAVYTAVKHFKYLLEGAPFIIRTDHQPLVHAFTKTGDASPSSQSRTTARIISSKFICHGMRKDITCWARSCINCQTSKISRHTTSEIGNFKQPMRRFGHVHIDVVGPLPPSRGDRFLLTVIDRSTHWIEATPMQDSSTPSSVNALLSSWISRFGVPYDIETDRGPAFLSDVWGTLTKSLGITAHSTSSYNPAANGMVERAHRSLKASLMAHCSDDNWKAQLPWVLLGLRTTSRSNGEPSSAEKVYGETIAVPGEKRPDPGKNQKRPKQIHPVSLNFQRHNKNVRAARSTDVRLRFQL
ncbi:uncharacterized protein [Palaemon carinicauda]|uniref:uncharacterized protein n=1 Tax=Palaemon carinicauda TaxID=392227 RepID=UPI0035B68CCD